MLDGLFSAEIGSPCLVLPHLAPDADGLHHVEEPLERDGGVGVFSERGEHALDVLDFLDPQHAAARELRELPRFVGVAVAPGGALPREHHPRAEGCGAQPRRLERTVGAPQAPTPRGREVGPLDARQRPVNPLRRGHLGVDGELRDGGGGRHLPETSARGHEGEGRAARLGRAAAAAERAGGGGARAVRGGRGGA